MPVFLLSARPRRGILTRTTKLDRLYAGRSLALSHPRAERGDRAWLAACEHGAVRSAIGHWVVGNETVQNQGDAGAVTDLIKDWGAGCGGGSLVELSGTA